MRLNVDRLRRLRRELFSDRVPDNGVEDRYAVAIAPWLLRALNDLTPRQRTAVVLRFTDDLDTAGIAREMGLLERHRPKPPVAWPAAAARPRSRHLCGGA